MKILCEQKTVIIDAGYFSYIIVIDSDFYVNFYLITLVSIFIQQPKVDLRSVMWEGRRTWMTNIVELGQRIKWGRPCIVSAWIGSNTTKFRKWDLSNAK